MQLPDWKLMLYVVKRVFHSPSKLLTRYVDECFWLKLIIDPKPAARLPCGRGSKDGIQLHRRSAD